MPRLLTLESFMAYFDLDPEEWEITKVNKWEQHSVRAGFVTLVQIVARRIRSSRVERSLEEARAVVQQLIEDAKAHMPPAPMFHPADTGLPDEGEDIGEKVLYEIVVQDAHIGMLAWGKEVGRPYDLDIAVQDFGRAHEGLLPYRDVVIAGPKLYPIEKYLIVVGNDFLHVDAPSHNVRGGATTAGTAQDVDTRLPKMFTHGRRALVNAIDRVRARGLPVDVIVVPGNHDEQQMYRMGETLSAWYRNDPHVNVIYGAQKRKYYRYGGNAFMFTHGEEYKRAGRDNLPLIFATEAPADVWAKSKVREIHTGHNHISMGGRYVPTQDQTETRAIRTRSLPGLTGTDAWHHVQGYKHLRAATALAFRKSGGLVSLTEFNELND